MTRDEFLAAMERELTRLKVSDRVEAMEYYIEYFEEAGPGNEQKVIAELGSPEKIAAQIRAQTTLKDAQKDPQNGKKSWLALLAAIGGVFAIPIALPLALSLAVVCFSLILVVMLLFGLFFLMAVLFGLGGMFFIPTLVLFRSCLRGLSSLLGRITQKNRPAAPVNPDSLDRN